MRLSADPVPPPAPAGACVHCHNPEARVYARGLCSPCWRRADVRSWYKPRPATPVPAWTADQLAALRAVYPVGGPAAAAAATGRSRTACVTKAGTLGVKAPPRPPRPAYCPPADPAAGNEESTLAPAGPTTARPGSEGKIVALAARVAARQRLWSPKDNQGDLR